MTENHLTEQEKLSRELFVRSEYPKDGTSTHRLYKKVKVFGFIPIEVLIMSAPDWITIWQKATALTSGYLLENVEEYNGPKPMTVLVNVGLCSCQHEYVRIESTVPYEACRKCYRRKPEWMSN